MYFCYNIHHKPLCYIVEPGTGSSKKNARRVAAEKMLEKLHCLSGSTEITWVKWVFIHPLGLPERFIFWFKIFLKIHFIAEDMPPCSV